jgi:hypothetical protein
MNSIINDFFNFNKKCPDAIKNCHQLRSEYIITLERLKSKPGCKTCDIQEYKNYFINKLKFSIFSVELKVKESKQIEKINTLKKKFLFLTPYNISLFIYNTHIKIIFLRDKNKVDTFITKYFIFLTYSKRFTLFFYNKFNSTFYIWLCKNLKDKKAFSQRFDIKICLWKLTIYM